MDNLVFEGSNDKPALNLDKKKGILFLGGSSLPENVLEFYNPVLDWLDRYIDDPNPITKIDFFFEYLNTASSQMIMRIFKKTVELNNVCRNLTINWYYPTGDLDMLQFGQELSEITNYPINIIARELNT
jgi:hypothetical protein